MNAKAFAMSCIENNEELTVYFYRFLGEALDNSPGLLSDLTWLQERYPGRNVQQIVIRAKNHKQKRTNRLLSDLNKLEWEAALGAIVEYLSDRVSNEAEGVTPGMIEQYVEGRPGSEKMFKNWSLLLLWHNRNFQNMANSFVLRNSKRNAEQLLMKIENEMDETKDLYNTIVGTQAMAYVLSTKTEAINKQKDHVKVLLQFVSETVFNDMNEMP